MSAGLEPSAPAALVHAATQTDTERQPGVGAARMNSGQTKTTIYLKQITVVLFSRRSDGAWSNSFVSKRCMYLMVVVVQQPETLYQFHQSNRDGKSCGKRLH